MGTREIEKRKRLMTLSSRARLPAWPRNWHTVGTQKMTVELRSIHCGPGCVPGAGCLESNHVGAGCLESNNVDLIFAP